MRVIEEGVENTDQWYIDRYKKDIINNKHKCYECTSVFYIDVDDLPTEPEMYKLSWDMDMHREVYVSFACPVCGDIRRYFKHYKKPKRMVKTSSPGNSLWSWFKK